MSLPKGYKNNINILRTTVGPERRQGILDDISRKGTFLPRGVGFEEMDQAFVESIDKDFSIVIDGEKVPVVFLSIQRWSEFSKTWQHADKYKDIKIPFITVVRQPNPQVGTNQAGLFNIPGRRSYTYINIPTNDGARCGIDTYKIPQPTSVDITYEVRLFCNKMKDLNKLHSVVQQNFQSKQHYIRVNGHPMPVTLENIGDESNIEDLEKRRFYVQLFEMKLAGYILDEDKFKVIPTINRALSILEVAEAPKTDKLTIKTNVHTKEATFSFIFKPLSEASFSFISEFDIKFNGLVNISNINNIRILVNNVEKINGLVLTNSFVVGAGESVFVEISKGATNTGKFQLIGNLI